MKIIKTILLTIVFTLPFLFADLYTKYLAHTELPNEGDQVVLIEPLYAVSPMINYGSIFETELKKENASHFAHLLSIPITILGAWAAYHAVGGDLDGMVSRETVKVFYRYRTLPSGW